MEFKYLMSQEILQLEPQAVWKHFFALTRLPRPSRHEGRVVEFLKSFGERLGLETLLDSAGNVIIRKPATPGMEKLKGVILQGHVDMVPQKNSDTNHDFSVDPIEAYLDGEWVTAKGTTLGSDNGVGVAAAMAVLESKTLRHGPLEALFTVDEETGMTGAKGLQPSLLKGEILLNTDSEDEGELYIGCAGGIDTNISFSYALEKVPDAFAAFKVSVKGLRGGHSGLDIHLGRGNACLIMSRLLKDAGHMFGLRLAEIDAGSLRNAIPREAFATVVVPLPVQEVFLEFVGNVDARAKSLLQQADPEVEIHCEGTEMPDFCIDPEIQNSLFAAVLDCPNGVMAWHKDLPGVVATSSSLASIKSDGEYVNIECLTRGAVDADRDVVAQNIAALFRKHNACVEHHGAYPGWQPDTRSTIVATMKQVYLETFDKAPEVKVIHAGLECGILGATYPHWEMISFGPTIRHPHSPDEKVNIESVGRFWEFLVSTLERIPAR
jgi:dipeptidase D